MKKFKAVKIKALSQIKKGPSSIPLSNIIPKKTMVPSITEKIPIEKPSVAKKLPISQDNSVEVKPKSLTPPTLFNIVDSSSTSQPPAISSTTLQQPSTSIAMVQTSESTPIIQTPAPPSKPATQPMDQESIATVPPAVSEVVAKVERPKSNRKEYMFYEKLTGFNPVDRFDFVGEALRKLIIQILAIAPASNAKIVSVFGKKNDPCQVLNKVESLMISM